MTGGQGGPSGSVGTGSRPLNGGPPLALSEQAVAEEFGRRFDLGRMAVLEIGGTLDRQQIAGLNPASWVSVDVRRRDRTGQQVQARAEGLPFRGRSFDAIFSCNALQFMDVGPLLAECRRVLRSGGVVFAHFGPIWSGPDGHQLEYVTYHGRDLLFWRDTYIPPYGHLVYTKEELRALLRLSLEPDLADILVWHVHDGPTINRLFFEDYLDLVMHSGFILEEVATSTFLDYAIDNPWFRPDLLRPYDEASVVKSLLEGTGIRRQIGIRDVRVVLRNPGY